MVGWLRGADRDPLSHSARADEPEAGTKSGLFLARVEPRRGALLGGRFGPSLRFLSQPIELDVPISRIRLSDQLHYQPRAVVTVA